LLPNLYKKRRKPIYALSIVIIITFSCVDFKHEAVINNTKGVPWGSFWSQVFLKLK